MVIKSLIYDGVDLRLTGDGLFDDILSIQQASTLYPLIPLVLISKLPSKYIAEQGMI